MKDLPPDEFTSRLRSYVRRRVPSSSDADDVVQTVLLRLLESEPGSDVAPGPWLIAAARNAIADHHRARARAARSLEEPGGVVGTEADDASDVARCLAPLLSRLSEEDRRVLERVDVEGASQADLAREEGVSASAMKSRVQRARSRLREAVLTHCAFERDASGSPVGPATCRTESRDEGCGCRRTADVPGCGDPGSSPAVASHDTGRETLPPAAVCRPEASSSTIPPCPAPPTSS